MGDINVINTNIKGLKVLEQEVFMDERGKFLKTFSKDIFAKNNLDIQIKETYFKKKCYTRYAFSNTAF